MRDRILNAKSVVTAEKAMIKVDGSGSGVEGPGIGVIVSRPTKTAVVPGDKLNPTRSSM